MKKDKTLKKPNTTKIDSLHTQSQPLSKRTKEKSQGLPDYDQYLRTQIDTPNRIRIKSKELEKSIWFIKSQLEEELELLLKKKRDEEAWKPHQLLIQIRLYRFRQTSEEQLLEEYGKLIQAAQLLYSKLHNNQRIKDHLYFASQQDLILFFKHLFGKPYTLCNLPHFRKILSIIWEKYHLPNMKMDSMLEDIKVWAHGIQLPMNPASVFLQRKVLTSPKALKEYASVHNNQACYSNIEVADCIGLNPLLLAVHTNSSLAYEPAIKSGANTFKCPLTLIKGGKSIQKDIKKSKQGSIKNIKLSYPIPFRHQFNAFEILLTYKQFQQVVNLLTFEEVAKIKEMKKNKATIYQRMTTIPDCCFQLHWKSFSKGFLSFKNLPKDVIVVYKKQGFLRIDYHVDDLEKPTPNGNFSILLRTFQQKGKKLQYYLINHNEKKIFDLTRQVDSQKMKLRYQQITLFGNIEDQTITSVDLTVTKRTQPQKDEYKMGSDLEVEYCYENVSKAQLFPFKTVGEYQKQLYCSEMIDYKAVEHGEMSSLLAQKIGNLPKVKSKQIKSGMSMKVEWVDEKITLNDFIDVLGILDKKSVLFIKLNLLFKELMAEPAFNKMQFKSRLPLKVSMDMGKDFRLSIELKNLLYCTLDDAVFGLEYRTHTQQYNEQNAGLQSLQETMIMDENYSIEISRFLGKTEYFLQRENEQANRRFDELVREMSENSDEERDEAIIPAYLME